MCTVYRLDKETGERRLAVKKDAYDTGLLVETLLYMFEKGIPTPYIAAPMIGATAPVTVGGAVALGIADNMVGLVLSQWISRDSMYRLSR